MRMAIRYAPRPAADKKETKAINCLHVAAYIYGKGFRTGYLNIDTTSSILCVRNTAISAVYA